MFIAKQLREQRFKLASDAQALIQNENATNEDVERFDAMMAEVDALKAKIDRVEKADAAVAEMSEIIGNGAERMGVSFNQHADEVEEYKAGIVAKLRHASGLPLSAKERDILASMYDFRSAASTGTNSAGGYTVPTTIYNEIVSVIALESGIAQIAKTVRTADGHPINIVLNDDTANNASIVGENASVGSGTDTVLSTVTLGSYKYTSGALLFSREILADSMFDFKTFVTDAVGHRFARKLDNDYTLGNGTTAPQGVVTAASSGTVGATGETASLVATDLIKLEHSVTVPYRQGAKFLMGDSMFRVIKSLQDTVGRFLWQPGLAQGAPDLISGYPVVLSASMANPAANAKTILFGQFENFWIRMVMDLQIKTLNELYAANDQIGIMGFLRTDSKLVSATAPIKYFQQSAT